MAVQPKCIICNKELEGGYQEIIYSKIDASDLPQEQKDDLKKKPEQVSYWAHDPRNPHCDVEVFAHRSCYEKVKAVYKNFDLPTQDDLDDIKYPVINDKTGAVELKKKDDFIKDKIITQ